MAMPQHKSSSMTKISILANEWGELCAWANDVKFYMAINGNKRYICGLASQGHAFWNFQVRGKRSQIHNVGCDVWAINIGHNTPVFCDGLLATWL